MSFHSRYLIHTFHFRVYTNLIVLLVLVVVLGLVWGRISGRWMVICMYCDSFCEFNLCVHGWK